jgi:DNA-binding IclR family transcriptional regulator
LAAFEDITKRYYLGPEVFVLGAAQPYSAWRSHYRTALANVAARGGDSSYLSIRESDDSLCIDRAEGRAAIRILFDIGSRLPLGAAASGVAMLAALPEAEAERLIRANAKRYKPHERLNGEVVRELVREARLQGYAVTHETLLSGVAGVAVPIWGQEGQLLGAMGVALPEPKASQERCAQIAEVMLEEIRRAGG